MKIAILTAANVLLLASSFITANHVPRKAGERCNPVEPSSHSATTTNFENFILPVGFKIAPIMVQVVTKASALFHRPRPTRDNENSFNKQLNSEGETGLQSHLVVL